jgi:ERCC4-type nuclease
MTILVDNREQDYLKFQHPYVESQEFCTLSVGDYSCRFKDGHTPPICFERKSIPDLFSSLTTNIDRFKNEIKRSHEQGIQLIIIIEGTISDIFDGHEYTKVQGLAILRTLLTLELKYNVSHTFCENRLEMQLYIVEKFCAYQRNRLKAKNVPQSCDPTSETKA